MSASTQELLNSLAISSSFDTEKSPSPTKFQVDEEIKVKEVKDSELALPTLAPTTSLAIHKLFTASLEKQDSDTPKILDSSIDDKKDSDSPSNAMRLSTEVLPRDINSLRDIEIDESYDDLKPVNISAKPKLIETKFKPISVDSIDEDCLLYTSDAADE